MPLAEDQHVVQALAAHQAYSINPPGTRGYAVERLDCPETAVALVRRQHWCGPHPDASPAAPAMEPPLYA